jgi:hypothetical protein
MLEAVGSKMSTAMIEADPGLPSVSPVSHRQPTIYKELLKLAALHAEGNCNRLSGGWSQEHHRKDESQYGLSPTCVL